MDLDIQNKITSIEEELKAYQEQRQQELDEFLKKVGVLDFVNETNNKIAYYRGKIDSLKELLPEEDRKDKVEVLK